MGVAHTISGTDKTDMRVRSSHKAKKTRMEDAV